MTRQKKRRYSIYLTVAMFCAICYFFVALFGIRAKVSAKQAEVDAFREKVEAQSEMNEELEALLDEGDLDAFVEKRAREEDMAYAYPDERIYYDMGAVK